MTSSAFRVLSAASGARSRSARSRRRAREAPSVPRLPASPSPKKELREDGHVFDLGETNTLADLVVSVVTEIAPKAEWTDTVIGIGRVTVSFSVPSAAVATQIAALAPDVVPKHWKLEEAVVGLDKRALDPEKIVGALGWLSSALPAADDAIRSVLGSEVARDAQLRVYVNTHPRMRTFAFSVVSGNGDEYRDPNEVDLPDAIYGVLGRFFDAPEDEARRICGPLWEKDIEEVERASRISLDASS